MATVNYQHVIPQRDLDHEPTPSLLTSFDTKATLKRLVCVVCGKKIVRVDENEGPESLKALFRF